MGWIWCTAPADLDLEGWQNYLASDALGWASNVGYFIAIGLIGPIYSSGGFALYLNQRTSLEGWTHKAA
jgi:hypothetical protein